jgi:hypothetical protein
VALLAASFSTLWSASASAVIRTKLWIGQGRSIWNVNTSNGSRQLVLANGDWEDWDFWLTGNGQLGSWRVFTAVPDNTSPRRLYEANPNSSGTADFADWDAQESSSDLIWWRRAPMQGAYGIRANGEPAIWAIPVMIATAPTASGAYSYYEEESLVRVNLRGADTTYTGLSDSWVWSGATTMAFLERSNTNEDLFIIADDQLWRVDTETGARTSLGTGWGGPAQMTSLNGSLYIAQDDALWRTNPSTGAALRVGPANVWNGATSIAAVYDSLYIIQDDYLHKVSPSTGTWTVLGDRVWSGPTSITGAWMDGKYSTVK